MLDNIPPLVDNRTASQRRGDPVARRKKTERGLLTQENIVEDAPNHITIAHKKAMFRAKEIFIEHVEEAALGLIDEMRNGENAKIRQEAKRLILERALGKPEASPSDPAQLNKIPVFNVFIGGKPVDSIDGIITAEGNLLESE